MESDYQICSRCIMDTSADNIKFDSEGVCNYCSDFLKRFEKVVNVDEDEIHKIVDKIKKDGKNKEYDCIIGISGGVDSSYLLYLVKELGLRPLATHMDNGWDTELAANNIANLVRKLGVDLYTYVIDWEEYRELMQSFFDANVVDIELLYDNALYGVNYSQARKYNIKYMLTGGNSATEGMVIPKTWNWLKIDGENIRSIHRKYNGKRIKSFPVYSIWNYLFDNYVRRIKKIKLLDYCEYKKDEALKILTGKFDYKPYPYKHYESVFTRFYQGYILPEKFNIDKRKLHLSNLIVTGQLKREEGLKILKDIPYPSERDLKEDREYFLKKMSWTDEQLQDYIKAPRVQHNEFGSQIRIYDFLLKFYKKHIRSDQ